MLQQLINAIRVWWYGEAPSGLQRYCSERDNAVIRRQEQDAYFAMYPDMRP